MSGETGIQTQVACFQSVCSHLLHNATLAFEGSYTEGYERVYSDDGHILAHWKVEHTKWELPLLNIFIVELAPKLC